MSKQISFHQGAVQHPNTGIPVVITFNEGWLDVEASTQEQFTQAERETAAAWFSGAVETVQSMGPVTFDQCARLLRNGYGVRDWE